MLWQLQVALDTQLYNNIIYNGEVLPVYDTVQQDASLPYLRFGEDTVNDWNTKTSYGGDITHTLHIFSQQKWKQEVKELMYKVEKALREPVLVNGFFNVVQRVEFQEVIEEDNDIKHGVMRIRARITETE